MKLLNYKQGSPEWLAMRRQAIGASDAAIIMGMSPYQTRYGLWEQKVLGKTNAETSAMTYGKQNEESARQLFERMTGITMFSDRTYAHDEKPWLIASLDGISLEEDTFVEIKMANREDHEIAKQGNIPDKYIPQVQQQSIVTGAKNGFYFSCRNEKIWEDPEGIQADRYELKGVIVDVKRDDTFAEKMMVAEEEFYYVNMLGMEAPALCDKDYIEMRCEIWDQNAYFYRDIDEKIKKLEKEKEMCRKELLRLSNGRNSKGNGVILTKSFRRGSIDYKAVPELSGIDLEQYRKPTSESWRLDVA